MRFNRQVVNAAIILAAILLIPRIYAGAIVVKYDVLFWNSQGNGYAPTIIAVGAKLLGCSLALAALYMLIGDRARRAAWSLTLVVSILAFLSISLPSSRDLPKVIEHGSVLVAKIESYNKQEGHYPSSLKLIPDVPQNGLVKERRFFYATAQNSIDDKGSWFNGARAYLAKSPYVICIPLVPNGTLVYRPGGNYSDLPGHRLPDGWFSTGD